jgi:hypothetical protein
VPEQRRDRGARARLVLQHRTDEGEGLRTRHRAWPCAMQSLACRPLFVTGDGPYKVVYERTAGE